ncbi:Transcription initiation factor TFIID subunit 4 [Mycena sanguinolenta]|uniref:Transcription initiation factor TFIID subunit 4 n=1 Tax=Mycena sanguinolenta TaxID=230812 RepID=A0A8H7DNN7_9AGAR|nr:Transcription initiation factor TFIID subunit 4 [Mycena sanguinolenta]
MSGPPTIPGISAELWDSLIPMDGDVADSDPTPTVVTTPSTTTTTPAYLQTFSSQELSVFDIVNLRIRPTSPYVPQQQNMARQAIANSQQANAGALDTADVATLNDAIGSAGVDLRAEEESLQRAHQQPQSFGAFEDRSRKQPARPNFDVSFLGSTMRAIATQHKVTAGVPEDCVNYLALALRARLQDLVTGMIDAARHRTKAHFDRPSSLYEDGSATWGILVRSDVAKQLAALEKVEREEEAREREARQRVDDAITAAIIAVLDGEDARLELPDDDMDVDRPRPRKRAVSEEAGRKMTNAAANRAAGVTGKYAWLSSGNVSRPNSTGATPPPRPYKPSNAVTANPPTTPSRRGPTNAAYFSGRHVCN